MKSYLRAAAVVTLTGFIAPQAYAATVEALVKAGNYQQAYEQGKKSQSSREGDPSFDRAFATAALRSGNPGDAIFAFDRILVMQPGDADARIGLAEALLAVDNSKQAIVELTVAGKSRLNPAQKQRVSALMNRTRKKAAAERDTVRAWVGLDFGHDSNVNQGTYHDSYTTPGNFTVALGNGATDQAAYFHRTSLGVTGIRRLNDGRALDLTAQVTQQENMGEEDTDTRNYKLNGGYSVNYKGDVYRVGGRFEQDDLDSDRQRNVWGIVGQRTTTGKYDWNRGWQQTLVTSLARVDYIEGAGRQGGLRDVDQALLGMVGRKEVGDFRHTLRGFFIYEDAQDRSPFTGQKTDYNGRRILTASWRAEYLDAASLAPMVRSILPGLDQYLSNMTPYADFGLSRVRHNDVLGVAAKHRNEWVHDLKLGMNWRWDKNLSFRAQYRNRGADSNISLYDYRRQIFEFGVRYDFM